MAATFVPAQHPRHPSGTEAGGEFAPSRGGLPEGYERRERRPLAASSKKRWTRAWGFTLRDLWEGGGHEWQTWGSGHMSSGITNALTDRGFIDTAGKKGKPLLYRLTPKGLGRLEEWYGDENKDMPDAPNETPYVNVLTPRERNEFRARRIERGTREQVARAHRAVNRPRIEELEDELRANTEAEARREALLQTDEAPFVDMELAAWQKRRAAEIRRELRGLTGG